MRRTPTAPPRALLAAALVLALGTAAAPARALDVEVWTDRGDDAVYREGDAMRVKVRTTHDAYLLVYELDTEGTVNLLYPWKRGKGFVEGRQTMRLPADESGYELVVGRETGQGFIVAVASDRPFRDLPWFLRPFDPQAASVGYEGAPQDAGLAEEGFDDRGRVVGDPYVAMERIRRRVLEQPGDLDGVASDYTTYYVHEVVRYPRYLCNDCHRPGYWAWWRGFDPYYASCSVFDFRVNWSWHWGPHLWTSYVPYYYYVVRTDCPPRYSHWTGNRNRFSAWDGWGRWSDLWGGQLRRYKPVPAPVSYSPPPPRGMIWRKGETPPGFVPSDVRRQTGTAGGGMRDWMNRDRGQGVSERPVRRGRDGQGQAPGVRPQGGVQPPRGESGDRPQGRWREVPRPGAGDSPSAPETRGRGQRERDPGWRPRGDSPSKEPAWRPRGDSPSREPAWRPREDAPRREPPRQDPPKQDPPRGQEPQRNDPGYRQPSPQQDPPRWSPPRGKPEPPRGKGGRGGGN
jgi:hypothetical protein